MLLARRPRSGLALLLTLGAALLLSAPPATGQPASPLVHIGTGPNDQALPLVYADKAGLFAKAGLNVTVTREINTSTEAAAIAGGSMQMAEGSGLGAVVLIAKGLPFTLVGNLSVYNQDRPNMGMLVAADSPIKSAKDLDGATIGTVGLQDMFAMSTRLWLDQHGEDPAKVHFIEIPASASLAALEQGRIQAYTTYEPFFSAAVASGKARALSHPFDAIGNHYSDAVLFAGTSWATEHRDLLQRVLHVIQESAAYAQAHEAEMVAYTAQFTGMEPDVVRSIHHPERIITIAPSDVQPLIDAAAKFKMIEKAVPAEQMICSCALKR